LRASGSRSGRAPCRPAPAVRGPAVGVQGGRRPRRLLFEAGCEGRFVKRRARGGLERGGHVHAHTYVLGTPCFFGDVIYTSDVLIGEAASRGCRPAVMRSMRSARHGHGSIARLPILQRRAAECSPEVLGSPRQSSRTSTVNSISETKLSVRNFSLYVPVRCIPRLRRRHCCGFIGGREGRFPPFPIFPATKGSPR